MEQMTAKEILNLIDWLREQGFDNDKVVECIEAVEGKKDQKKKKLITKISRKGQGFGSALFG